MSDREPFESAGYTIEAKVFSEEALENIRASIQNSPPFNTSVWHKEACASSHNFLQFATNPRILEALKPLLGPDIILWGGSYLERTPGQVHHWHTDIESSRPEGGFVTVWIGLDGTNQKSALKLVPHSQNFDQALQQAIELNGKDRESTTDDDVVAWARSHQTDHPGILQPDVGNGDAILFDGRLWHGSNNANIESTRTAFLFQYARADVPVRIPDFNQLSWPFKFFDTPKPPCISVCGEAQPELNHIVEPPPPLTEDLTEVQSRVYPIDLNATDTAAAPFQPFPLIDGYTSNLQRMRAHYSVLAPGHSPHPPHAHVDEEILIVLKGAATLSFDQNGQLTKHQVSAGDCIYYPSFHRHTITNHSDAPVMYLMFKWVAAQKPEKRTLSLERFRVEALATSAAGKQSFAPQECFTGPTDQLKQLHSHISTLLPGGGYESHADEHDVAIILFEGCIETNGQSITPGQLVWHRAGVDHDMWNRSDAPARYLVIEFHGENCSGDYASYSNPDDGSNKSRRKKRKFKRIIKNIKRLFGIRSK